MHDRNKKLTSLEPKRILIVRLSAIGDVVCGLPVLVALRNNYPHAKIAWLVEDNIASLIHGHHSIDKLITVPKRWLKSPIQIISLRKKLLAFAPDLTVDIQCLLKSSVAAWLSGAKNRIGFGGKDGREGSRWFNNIKVIANQTHVIDRNMQLLAPLGITDSPIVFDLPENNSDKMAIEQMLKNLKLTGHFAVLNVGASTECKKWSKERFTQLGRYLFEKWNLPSLVISGSEHERKIASQIATASHGAISLAPELSLPELTVLSGRATLFISNDTGPLHIAAATGTKCIGLFGPTLGARTGPYGIHNKIVQIKSPLNGIVIRHTSQEFMETIQPEDVTKVCDEILREIKQ